jgi:hypothetical protein
LKKLYIDLTPYLIKVRGLISSREDLSEARIYTKFFTYAWFIDVDLLKKLVEEKDFSDDQKAKIYMAAFKKFIRTLSSRMKVCDDKDKIIYDLIPTINKFISNKNVDEYDYKDYMEYLLCFCKGDYKDGDWKLNEDQKESLFKSSIEPWLNRDCPFTRYPLCDVYLGAAMCLTPNDKLDEMVKKLNNIFSLSKILCVLVEEVRLSGSTLDVTENITNMLIEHGYTWTNNLVIPREKAYDLDYLESICDKVGEEGILFGSQWNDNYFGIRHVDVKRLPDEFYTKYAEYIYWVDLSRSPFIDLEYMKKHFNSIKFGYISSKVSAFIDDEMAKKILEKYHEVGYRYIQYSESLSLEFTAKHLNHLWYNEYCRKVSFLGGKGYAIKELLEAM